MVTYVLMNHRTGVRFVQMHVLSDQLRGKLGSVDLEVTWVLVILLPLRLDVNRCLSPHQLSLPDPLLPVRTIWSHDMV